MGYKHFSWGMIRRLTHFSWGIFSGLTHKSWAMMGCATRYSATVGNVGMKIERKILNIDIFKLLKRMDKVVFSTVAL